MFILPASKQMKHTKETESHIEKERGDNTSVCVRVSEMESNNQRKFHDKT